MSRGLGNLQRRVLGVLVENTIPEEEFYEFFKKWGCDNYVSFFSKYHRGAFGQNMNEAWTEYEKMKPVYMSEKEIMILLGLDRKNNSVKASVSRAIRTLRNRGLIKSKIYWKPIPTLEGRKIYNQKKDV